MNRDLFYRSNKEDRILVKFHRLCQILSMDKTSGTLSPVHLLFKFYPGPSLTCYNIHDLKFPRLKPSHPTRRTTANVDMKGLKKAFLLWSTIFISTLACFHEVSASSGKPQIFDKQSFPVQNEPKLFKYKPRHAHLEVEN